MPQEIDSIKHKKFYLKYHNWDDGGVVFDKRSGYTHLLDIQTMSVFLVMANEFEKYSLINPDRVSLIALSLPNLTTNEIERALKNLSTLNIMPI